MKKIIDSIADNARWLAALAIAGVFWPINRWLAWRAKRKAWRNSDAYKLEQLEKREKRFWDSIGPEDFQ